VINISEFKEWFDGYAGSFFGDDAHVNANLQLKKTHTEYVCREMEDLCENLDLGENDRLIAGAIALFHDVGRFPQFAKYKTYRDDKSLNHACLGVNILQENAILDGLDAGEKEIILAAVRLHGDKRLPLDLDEKTGLFAKLIRDVDKLDIFRFAIEAMKAYMDDPANFMLEVEFSDERECNPEIVQAVINGDLIDYKKVKTLDDMRLTQLGWVYDVNFKPTFKKIKERGCLGQVSEFLVKTPETEKAAEAALRYVDEHCL
jgi:putative nucleotidyltransferase with HDIG domain